MLEALGNAKTSNNDNSSRFTKYLNLSIDTQNMAVVGYEIKTHVLEKTLIVNNLSEDRKFHVFYAIMKHMPSEDKEKYKFKHDFSQYSYIVHSLSSVSKNQDARTYQNILSSFEIFGYTAEEQGAFFTLLSVILLIGNIQFKPEVEKGREV